MDQVKAFLDLPVGTLALLAIGYIGYRLAYVGRDKPHKAADTVFLSLVWAAIAKSVSATVLAETPNLNPAWVFTISAGTAIALAIFWRVLGQEAVFKLFRWSRLLDHDGQISAWDTLLARGPGQYSRLLVKQKDGTALLSDDLGRFSDYPLGPCVLGADGSIGLYITDIMRADEAEWTSRQPADENEAHADFRYTMTFIPASEISQIQITMPR